MNNIYIPEATQNQQRICAGNISFVHYIENDSLKNSRVIFNCYAISFVINGEKAIFRPSNNTIVETGEGIVIPQGNSIMAEHTLNEHKYASILLFFPASVATNFLNKHKLQAKTPTAQRVDYIKFRQTNYMAGYLKSVQALIHDGQPLPYELALHKVEELLLVLLQTNREALIALLQNNAVSPSFQLKNLVENNLFNNLTLDELAFLAHKSLASFKRDFEKIYHVAPAKYIRERKMEIARQELAQGKNASSLYIDLGYDNLSNFSLAFKKQFGVSPRQYQLSAQAV